MIRSSEILVVDPDPSARATVLQALRRDGLRAVGASGREEALSTFAAARPGLVISELELADGDGLGLIESLRAQGAVEVPVLLLSRRREPGDPGESGKTGAAKARALGAEDLFPKPLFARDLVTLSRLHQGRPAGARVIEGRLETTSAAHLLRALASGSRSGRVIFLEGEGEVSFRDGRILDASFRQGCGESALLRLLTLTRGPFHLFFEAVGGSGAMALSVDDLLRRGLPFVQRWEAIVSRLPVFEARLSMDFRRLAEALASLPDRVNEVIRLFDGRRDIEAVLADSPLAELTTLEVIDRLIGAGILLLPAGAEAAEHAEAGASRALLHTLFGDGLEASKAGARALAGQTPSGWVEGAPLAWEVLDSVPEPASQATALTHGLTDGSALAPSITAWDLPAAIEDAGRIAHAAALDGSSIGEEALALAGAADLGASEAPDFGSDVDQPGAEQQDVAEESFFADTEFELPTPQLTPSTATRWPLWLGAGVLTLGLLTLGVILTSADGAARDAAIPRGTIIEATPPAPLEEEITEAAPPLVPTPRDDLWLATELAEGARAYAAGEYADAVLSYAGAAIERRDSLEARLGLGLAYLELGDLEGATAAFRAALELAPASGRAIALLGSSLQIAGQRVEARRVYERYLKAHPEGPQAVEIRAVLAGFDE